MFAIRKTSTFLILILVFIVVLFSSTGLYTVYVTHTIKRDAEIINKLGIIRGSIQRLVKLELSNSGSEELIYTIDTNLKEFKEKEIKIYNESYGFQKSLDKFYPSWVELKNLIYTYRAFPTEIYYNELLDKSETAWYLADELVSISQISSENKVNNYNVTYIFIGINLILGALIIYLIKKYVKDNLEESVNIDTLTKTYNRRYFNDYLFREIYIAERYKKQLSLIMFDIDHFKNVNDTFGHDVGDSVLLELASLINGNIREGDVLCRIGGEELAIISVETPIEKAMILSENIRKIVEQFEFKAAGKITISLGITQFTSGDDTDTIFKRADNALYKAKNNGRNKTEIEL